MADALKTMLATLCLLVMPLCAQASSTSPDLDERVQQLATELRCLVCQNQSIADSQAPLAVQLRAEIHRQLSQGASDDAVRQFMAARYGDYVLYKPPINSATWALWAGPLLFTLAGGVAALRYVRGRTDRDGQG